ncbi:carbohydrate ABC transporter permease [Jiangella alkaliphila]|uniref:Multiple sugar transport system permease protein n=1 Tax=Jiangella alkaliphila TaxID=419479 RepID=A0A1H2JMC1_9ACTN|nr:sugar ABC transporter permease [Jiangella alkaliphila]SDU57286.1 multiple sugar transport system permease protein [Jiangella alkaliphila]
MASTHAPARRPRAAGRPRAARWRRHAWSYAFLVPGILLFGGFSLWPLIASWWYAFFDWDGVGTPTNWIGFDNFREVLGSDAFWDAFWHSFLFSFAALVIELPLALVLAILLNNAWLRGRNVYRLALFLPVVTTTAVIGIVFAILLDPIRGVVNTALTDSGLVGSAVNFLGDTTTALPTLIGIDVWKGFGITLIYWLAALQTIPKDIHEAALIDGANSRQSLRFVVLPMLVPLAIVILLLVFQRSLNTFDLVQATTQGGPNYSTDVVPTYIYRFAFDPFLQAPRYGFACAAGAVFGLMTLLITLMQAPLLRGRYKAGAP